MSAYRVIAAFALVVGGCANSAPPIAASSQIPAATRAQQVAAALDEAAQADASGNKAALSHAVAVLDRTGAHALDGGIDPLPAWRARAGNAPPPMRGSPLGPGYRSGRISVGGRDSFAQLFLSGTGASIALSSPSGDRVSLRVLDPQAHPICDDGNKKDRMCRWVPLFTQRYTIEVLNTGASDARYFLVVE